MKTGAGVQKKEKRLDIEKRAAYLQSFSEAQNLNVTYLSSECFTLANDSEEL